jgi:hypothetical protein
LALSLWLQGIDEAEATTQLFLRGTNGGYFLAHTIVTSVVLIIRLLPTYAMGKS